MAEPVSTIDEFLTVVKKSGLVDEARLEEASAPWTDRSQPLPDELPAALVAAELLTQWQVDQLRKGKHRGFLLGKYKLLRLLGAGGMSSVYLAEHVNLHGKVAIKVLPVKNVDKTSYLARFEREAREAFRLSHNNIVRALDLDTSGAIHFLAMEYVEGTDLHAKVKQEGPLPIHEAADLIRQAALGLQYAHEDGVVHRDIKPANLMLDRRGTVKILDFGLALAGKGDDDGSVTQEFGEKMLGTADYLAPEQARDSHKADGRSDIYSLGCTLYYLLVGKVPFAGGKLADRIRAHETQPPPNPLDERPDVPPAIAELYFRMMAKHPEARPQTAREVAETLAPFTSARPAGAAPAAPPRRLPPRRSGDAGRATPPPAPGPVALAPPGSGLGRRQAPPRSGASGSLSFAPPRSGVSVAPGKVKVGKASAETGHGGSSDEANKKPKAPRKPLTFAGLPIGFWIAAAAGLIVATTLLVMVLQPKKKRSKPKEEATTEISETAETPAEAAGNDEGPPAKKGKKPQKSEKPGRKKDAEPEPIDNSGPLSSLPPATVEEPPAADATPANPAADQ